MVGWRLVETILATCRSSNAGGEPSRPRRPCVGLRAHLVRTGHDRHDLEGVTTAMTSWPRSPAGDPH
jgi:hypothetical protein